MARQKAYRKPLACSDRFPAVPYKVLLGLEKRLQKKPKNVFMLHLQINQLAEFKMQRRMGERQEIPRRESLHLRDYVKSHKENV